MTSESIEIANKLYQQGKAAFENGKYREAVENLEKASSLAAKNSRFGGEVSIWLATAYEANDRNQDAIALCQQLKRHPHSETSQQAARLEYIWNAPKLKRPQEWMTEIPDFSNISDNEQKVSLVTNSKGSTNRRKKPPEPEYIDLSQVNTSDNQFIWVALLAVAMTISYLLWLGFN
jgi:outer membrane protein assembly factor BamD (BamD/ComL family)